MLIVHAPGHRYPFRRMDHATFRRLSLRQWLLSTIVCIVAKWLGAEFSNLVVVGLEFAHPG
ncbi:MAG: hypothetical protein DWH91_15470 [Planctomycetota bacterium]|nr:MAG: hypothetical protein DWH91_15470 [Planctomycetota bacterium]